jgi:hypothetical protein
LKALKATERSYSEEEVLEIIHKFDLEDLWPKKQNNLKNYGKWIYTYEQVDLKELGFDEPVVTYYTNWEHELSGNSILIHL